MKKSIIQTILPIVILGTLSSSVLGASESQKAESQSSSENSGKVSKAQIIGNALLLANIYRKIEKISGTPNAEELSPLLNQLDKGLDEVLAFKNSFTPEKRKKVETQLNKLKSQIKFMAESQSKNIQTNTLQLTSTLIDLVDTLLDKSKGNAL